MLLEFLNHPFKCLKFLITETETENVIKVKRLDKKKKKQHTEGMSLCPIFRQHKNIKYLGDYIRYTLYRFNYVK